MKLSMMFLVHWAYALASILVLVTMWFYIGQVNPGSARGKYSYINNTLIFNFLILYYLAYLYF